MHFKAVIPAKLVPACRQRGAGIQFKIAGFPRIKCGAGSVKPGMTIKTKGLTIHYTRS